MPDAAANELTARILEPPGGSENHFSISVDRPKQGEVIVTCRGLGGNQPKDYLNSLALWSTSLPNLAAKPLKLIQMPSNNQPNRVVFSYNFEPTDYSLTYQVGPDPSTACAMTFLLLFPTGLRNVPTSVSLDILRVTTESIEVRYTTLPGYQPEKNGNWIGIWRGFMVPYSAPAPIRQSLITSSQSEDVVKLDQITLRGDLDYTLIYFMEDRNPLTAGALLYFSL
jgi:hypothetical protein